jgi:Ca-activated chloride channel homolog
MPGNGNVVQFVPLSILYWCYAKECHVVSLTGKAPQAPWPGVRRPTALAVVLALGIATVSSACTFVRQGSAGCRAAVLRVVTAPQITPAVESIAAGYNASHPKVGGRCVRVEVAQAAPAGVASSLSGQGVITAFPSPDAWIPDSTLWIDQARSTAVGAARVAATGRPVAMSPVVLALPRPVADKIARSHLVASWKMLMPNSLLLPGNPAAAAAAGGTRQGPPFRLKILDPVSNAAGAATLLAMRAVAGHGQAGLVNFVTAARVAQFLTEPADSSLFRDLFASSAPTGGMTTEQAVWAHNVAQPTRPVVAVYLAEGSPMLDFPYVAASADPVKQQLIAAFGRAMTSESSEALIRARGLRAPDGTAAPGFGSQLGVRQRPPAPIPLANARVATAVRQMWGRILLGARMLIVLDVSPSMGAMVPGTGLSRLAAMTELTELGLGLFDKNDVIGLWTFDTGLTDPANYRVVLPMRPLNARVSAGAGRASPTQLKLLLGALAAQQPEVDTITALYETIRSAFAEVSGGYTPDRFNGVIVLTDGTNYDPRPHALSLGKLLATLRSHYDPQRPVNVLIVGYGHNVDFGAMKAIAKATGGAVYEAGNPAGIEKFYLQMLTRLVCDHNCPLP